MQRVYMNMLSNSTILNMSSSDDSDDSDRTPIDIGDFKESTDANDMVNERMFNSVPEEDAKNADTSKKITHFILWIIKLLYLKKENKTDQQNVITHLQFFVEKETATQLSKLILTFKNELSLPDTDNFQEFLDTLTFSKTDDNIMEPLKFKSTDDKYTENCKIFIVALTILTKFTNKVDISLSNIKDFFVKFDHIKHKNQSQSSDVAIGAAIFDILVDIDHSVLIKLVYAALEPYATVTPISNIRHTMNILLQYKEDKLLPSPPIAAPLPPSAVADSNVCDELQDRIKTEMEKVDFAIVNMPVDDKSMMMIERVNDYLLADNKGNENNYSPFSKLDLVQKTAFIMRACESIKAYAKATDRNAKPLPHNEELVPEFMDKLIDHLYNIITLFKSENAELAANMKKKMDDCISTYIERHIAEYQIIKNAFPSDHTRYEVDPDEKKYVWLTNHPEVVIDDKWRTNRYDSFIDKSWHLSQSNGPSTGVMLKSKADLMHEISEYVNQNKLDPTPGKTDPITGDTYYLAENHTNAPVFFCQIGQSLIRICNSGLFVEYFLKYKTTNTGIDDYVQMFTDTINYTLKNLKKFDGYNMKSRVLLRIAKETIAGLKLIISQDKLKQSLASPDPVAS